MENTYRTPEERARKLAIARKRKKVTGGYCVPHCAVCGHEYTDEELLAEDFIYSVGVGHSVQICKGCLAAYLGGVILCA